ncbi:MAG TPA: hypothetical protein VN805_11745 [Caulobacteraceae bacterium]|nr:hypothetical protein [Caulobacteraceae bacterium]
MTYTVLHGAADSPSEHAADTLGAAARIAVAFVREDRRHVRVRCPDGAVMDFQAFQEAVFQGDLKD